ncbi:MAG TPA: sulfur reduction protein DsrE [Chloroflexi bacterium]|nr:sulfur reduction protein DsrE [Chloroflexota bacterium]
MADEDKILIIMTSGKDTPRRCATPFFFASLAAAMDYEVTMFFTIDGTTLLEKGVAETVYPREGGENVAKYMNDCIEADIPFYCCTASMELHGLTKEDLIDHVELVGGATMWELADDAGKVLTF